MTTEINSQISDLMDNELDAGQVDQALAKLQKDPEAQKTWARYHLMRDVMQNDYSPVLSADFASKISSAIESEPAIVAFPAKESAAAATDSSVSGGTSNVVARPAFNWKRNVTGLAVAASVAMVSVVGLNTLRDADNGVSNGTVVASGAGQNAVQNPAVSGQLELVSNRGTHWVSTGENTLSAQGEKRLNMLLSRHIENAPTTHSGMVPYSRLVGYDEARPVAE